MLVGNYELQNWILSQGGNPVRYSVNYSFKVDACVIIVRTDVNHSKYSWTWKPIFHHNLYFLNEIFKKYYGEYIYGSEDIAKKMVDDFLLKIDKNKMFW